jgi:hypothetical protein
MAAIGTTTINACELLRLPSEREMGRHEQQRINSSKSTHLNKEGEPIGSWIDSQGKGRVLHRGNYSEGGRSWGNSLPIY